MRAYANHNGDRMMVGAAALALCVAPAQADQARCEADARAALLDVSHAMPMRQNVTTQMGDNMIKSAALSTPDGRGMALDANDTPVSLWIGGRFYTSTDGGGSWNLLQEQTQEQLDAQAAGRQKQADEATNIICEYDIELEGKTVHRLAIEYALAGSGIPVASQYWVDVETGFPWRVVHAFGGAAPSVITQDNVPMPDLTIDDPQG